MFEDAWLFWCTSKTIWIYILEYMADEMLILGIGKVYDY